MSETTAGQGAARADLGFGAELDGFDPADWTPKPRPTPEAQQAARELAEATGFRSREPAAAPMPAPMPTPVPAPQPAAASQTASGAASGAQAPQPRLRRRRTGRNAQFNIKARPDTIEAFCAVADANGWGLGETLEHAVALLQARHGTGQGG